MLVEKLQLLTPNFCILRRHWWWPNLARAQRSRQRVAVNTFG